MSTKVENQENAVIETVETVETVETETVVEVTKEVVKEEEHFDVQTILAKIRKRAGQTVISNVPSSCDGLEGLWTPNSKLEITYLGKNKEHAFLTGIVELRGHEYTASLYISNDQGFTMQDVRDLLKVPMELRNQIRFTLSFSYNEEKKRIYPNIVG